MTTEEEGNERRRANPGRSWGQRCLRALGGEAGPRALPGSGGAPPADLSHLREAGRSPLKIKLFPWNAKLEDHQSPRKTIGRGGEAGQARPGHWRGRGGGREGTKAGSSGLPRDTGIRCHSSSSGSPAPGLVGPSLQIRPLRTPPFHTSRPRPHSFPPWFSTGPAPSGLAAGPVSPPPRSSYPLRVCVPQHPPGKRPRLWTPRPVSSGATPKPDHAPSAPTRRPGRPGSPAQAPPLPWPRPLLRAAAAAESTVG